jgi:hypothetical protein
MVCNLWASQYPCGWEVTTLLEALALVFKKAKSLTSLGREALNLGIFAFYSRGFDFKGVY